MITEINTPIVTEGSGNSDGPDQVYNPALVAEDLAPHTSTPQAEVADGPPTTEFSAVEPQPFYPASVGARARNMATSAAGFIDRPPTHEIGKGIGFWEEARNVGLSLAIGAALLGVVEYAEHKNDHHGVALHQTDGNDRNDSYDADPTLIAILPPTEAPTLAPATIPTHPDATKAPAPASAPTPKTANNEHPPVAPTNTAKVVEPPAATVRPPIPEAEVATKKPHPASRGEDTTPVAPDTPDAPKPTPPPEVNAPTPVVANPPQLEAPKPDGNPPEDTVPPPGPPTSPPPLEPPQ